jgi:hypothetical protein
LKKLFGQFLVIFEEQKKPSLARIDGIDVEAKVGEP